MKNIILLMLAGLLCFAAAANAQSNDSIAVYTHTQMLASEFQFDLATIVRIVYPSKEGQIGADIALQFEEADTPGDRALIIWVHIGPKNWNKFRNILQEGDFIAATTFKPILTHEFSDGKDYYAESRATIKKITRLQREVLINLL